MHPKTPNLLSYLHHLFQWFIDAPSSKLEVSAEGSGAGLGGLARVAGPRRSGEIVSKTL